MEKSSFTKEDEDVDEMEPGRMKSCCRRLGVSSVLRDGRTMKDEVVEEAEHSVTSAALKAMFDENSEPSSAMEGRVHDDIVADSEYPRLRQLGRLSGLGRCGTGVGDLGTGSTDSSSSSESMVSPTPPPRGRERLRLLPLGKEYGLGPWTTSTSSRASRARLDG